MIVTKKPDDMLKHNVDHGGMLFKYDLPIVNLPFELKSSLIPKEEVKNTALENIFE